MNKLKETLFLDAEFPLISIAIPVYNTSKYLDKCISSAVAQDYTNLEIVILNNGSIDNSWDIIQAFAQKDSRIRSYSIKHVPTVKESKDNCYKHTRGEWVITLDSDDAISPTYVSDLWKSHKQSGADMVIAQRLSVNEEGDVYGYLPVDNFDFSLTYEGNEAMRRTIVRWEMSVNGALIHKDVLYNIMLSNPNCKIFTDEYDSRVLLKSSKLVAFCKTKYYYTFNPNSVGKKNNWNRHKFRLNTRLGLLTLTEQEYSINSKEFNAIVFQSLGISIVACLHFLKCREEYSEIDVSEFRGIINNIFDNSKISHITIKNILNIPLKFVLRCMMLFCRI